MDIAIDVDGVVADLVNHVLTAISLAMPEEKLPLYEEVKADLFKKGDSPLSPAALNVALELMRSPEFISKVPLIAGATEGIVKLKAAGHQIYWTTASWQSSKTWDYDRRSWILRTFGDDHEKVIITHAKHMVDTQVLIDDRVRNIRRWIEKYPGRKALLYSQPWNAEYDLYQRFTWADIPQLLEELKWL